MGKFSTNGIVDFQVRTRFVMGKGAIEQLGSIARDLGATRVLTVTDRGIVGAGHFATSQRTLSSIPKMELESFHDFTENPTSDQVLAGVEVCRRFQPDLLVGLGGGSSMDCAKGMNFVYSCGGRIEDYWGIGKATGELLPLIAVPTTAGTGSEAQSFALISDPKSHVKMACGDPRASCRVAILDPELTLTQPPMVTALTGIDAISHALETYVTTARTAFSMALSRQAFSLLFRGLPKVLEAPGDMSARSDMQIGACLAGMAIEASMLGAAHATANPLTAAYGIPHGQAVGVMLPAVVKLNGSRNPSGYADILKELGQADRSVSVAVDPLADGIRDLLLKSGLKTNLRDLEVPEDDLKMLAESALKQWTGTFNPVPLTKELTYRLYRESFSG